MGGAFGGTYNSSSEYLITYDGVFNENYFPIKSRENDLINNIEISHAQVKNPITNETELFLGLIMKSKYDGTPGIREPIDICITLDISGSMTSKIGPNQDDDKSRNDLSIESIVKLTQQLNDDDGIAINTFDLQSHNIVPFKLKKNLTQQNINDIKAIKPWGDENIYNALEGAMQQLEHSTKKNKRIIIITDLWAHDKTSNFEELFKKCVHEKKIEITIIGISQDANSHLAELVAYEKGCNYYNVLNSDDLEKYLVKRFNYICFPYCYNAKIKYTSKDLKVVESIGVGDKEINGNDVDICEMGSGVPSELNIINDEIYMQGGLILLKLKQQNEHKEDINFSCELILEYYDRNFIKIEQKYKYEVKDDKNIDNYFSSKAIEQGMALYYYTLMCRNLLNYKNAYNQNKFFNLRADDNEQKAKWEKELKIYEKYHDMKLIKNVMEFMKAHYLSLEGLPGHYERYEEKIYQASELETPKRYQGE